MHKDETPLLITFSLFKPLFFFGFHLTIPFLNLFTFTIWSSGRHVYCRRYFILCFPFLFHTTILHHQEESHPDASTVTPLIPLTFISIFYFSFLSLSLSLVFCSLGLNFVSHSLFSRFFPRSLFHSALPSFHFLSFYYHQSFVLNSTASLSFHSTSTRLGS